MGNNSSSGIDELKKDRKDNGSSTCIQQLIRNKMSRREGGGVLSNIFCDIEGEGFIHE